MNYLVTGTADLLVNIAQKLLDSEHKVVTIDNSDYIRGVMTDDIVFKKYKI